MGNERSQHSSAMSHVTPPQHQRRGRATRPRSLPVNAAMSLIGGGARGSGSSSRLSREQLNALIEADLDSVYSALLSLEGDAEYARHHVASKHDQFASYVVTRASEVAWTAQRIRSKQLELKRQARAIQQLELERATASRSSRSASVTAAQPGATNRNTPSSPRWCTFLANTRPLEQIVVDHLYYVNANWSMYNKLKYLRLFDRHETVSGDPRATDCYNHVVVPLSRNKIFYCLAVFGKNSYMKLTDARGRELCRRPIAKTRYYKEFLAYGSCIAGLFEEERRSGSHSAASTTVMSVIELYDDELRLTSAKAFDHQFKLLYLNESELVCMSARNRNQYFFFDYRLAQTFSFRVLPKAADSGVDVVEPTEALQLSSPPPPAPTTIADGDIVLLGSNQSEIFLFHVRNKFLKIVDRVSGSITSTVDFETLDLKQMSSVRLDRWSNFLCRSGQCALKYYDTLGNHLAQAESHQLLAAFNHFDFTAHDDIYACDNLKKVIHFL